MVGVHFVALPGWGQTPSRFDRRVFAGVKALPGVSMSVATYGPDCWSIYKMGQFVWANTIDPLPSDTKVVLVGYSMGGFIADSMMADPRAKHKLAGVVFISTASTHTKHVLCDTIHTHVAATMKQVHEDAAPISVDSVFAEEDLDKMSEADRAALHRALQMPKDLSAQKAAWKMQAFAIFAWCMLETPTDNRGLGLPVLIIHGQRDVLVSVASAYQLHTFFSPNSTLVVLPDAGHTLLREFHGTISETIARWARKL